MSRVTWCWVPFTFRVVRIVCGTEPAAAARAWASTTCGRPAATPTPRMPEDFMKVRRDSSDSCGEQTSGEVSGEDISPSVS